MPDDLTKKHPHDGKRINRNQQHEVKRWSEELGITPKKLKKIMDKVGDRVEAVKAEIERQRKPPSSPCCPTRS